MQGVLGRIVLGHTSIYVFEFLGSAIACRTAYRRIPTCTGAWWQRGLQVISSNDAPLTGRAFMQGGVRGPAPAGRPQDTRPLDAVGRSRATYSAWSRGLSSWLKRPLDQGLEIPTVGHSLWRPGSTWDPCCTASTSSGGLDVLAHCTALQAGVPEPSGAPNAAAAARARHRSAPPRASGKASLWLEAFGYTVARRKCSVENVAFPPLLQSTPRQIMCAASMLRSH
eukprot:361582-Chlamydomonas_euryale.AAC.1